VNFHAKAASPGGGNEHFFQPNLDNMTIELLSWRRWHYLTHSQSWGRWLITIRRPLPAWSAFPPKKQHVLETATHIFEPNLENSPPNHDTLVKHWSNVFTLHWSYMPTFNHWAIAILVMGPTYLFAFLGQRTIAHWANAQI